MEVLFWICLILVVYPYSIYPFLLSALNRLGPRRRSRVEHGYQPEVSVILPVHNEAGRIEAKIENLLSLDYPRTAFQIIAVGDGCTDDTLIRAQTAGAGTVEIVELAERSGKAAALNAGLERANGEVIVFTDAGIMLEHGSLRHLVAHFADPEIGCVSGEDYIDGSATEGLYGRLELLLRREEAKLHSIAGASGCFYAQRRALCRPFAAGMAPDFLSVLVTVGSGARAGCEPRARGSMTATSSQGKEFERKVRTLLRGMTAMGGNLHLLNPFRHPAFAFILASHKLLRWFAPIPMLACLVLAWFLRAAPLYAFLFYAQAALYLIALAGLAWPRIAGRSPVVRIASFFVLVNAAALKALLLWIAGTRVEVWQPTRRPG